MTIRNRAARTRAVWRRWPWAAAAAAAMVVTSVVAMAQDGRLICVRPQGLAGITCNDGNFYEGPKPVTQGGGFGSAPVDARTAAGFERILDDKKFHVQRACQKQFRTSIADQDLCLRREMDRQVRDTGDRQLIEYYRNAYRLD